MSQTIPTQHPAVVLRSHYRAVRTMLLIAMVAVVGLSVATVILALDDDTTTSGTSHVTQSLRGSSPFESRPDESNVASTLAQPPTVAQPERSKAAASAILIRHRAPAPPSTQANTRPDESTVASAISTPREQSRPDESNVATAVSGASSSDYSTRPDESKTATTISGN